MDPNWVTSTANVTSKRPHWLINLETKLKGIKDYEGSKLVIIIACTSDMSHPTVATTILKNKDKVMGTVKGYASLQVTRPTKI